MSMRAERTNGLRQGDAATVAAVGCVADVMGGAEFFPGADAVGPSAAGRLSA